MVGMASLLPDAGDKLTISKIDDKCVPVYDGKQIENRAQRMDVLKKMYGQRFAEMTIMDYIKNKKKLSDDIELFVLRSSEIDSHLETDSETVLGLIHDSIKRIRAAINRLQRAGFNDVVIATDHGFFLNTHNEAGDVCQKPAGNWVAVHERCLLGSGNEDSYSAIILSENISLLNGFSSVSIPRGLVTYRTGDTYFHGGASLQESIVPVITVKLDPSRKEKKSEISINISYKNGTTNVITTRLPVIDIQISSVDLFSHDADFAILLEAHDKNGKVVGEAKAGGVVNPATGTITLATEEKIRVTLKMQMEFEGKFTVKALNPSTLTTYSTIKLETDYAV